MDEELTIGAVVQLTSGGPLMTVSSEPFPGPSQTGLMVWCTYFLDGQFKSQEFDVRILRLVPM